MKTEKLFEKFVADGPDGLTVEELREAFDFEEREPQLALTVRLRDEAAKRDRERKDLMRETYVRQGGDLSQFEAAYRQLAESQRRQALEQAENDVKGASFRRMREGF